MTENLLADLIARVRAAGADAAEAVLVGGAPLGVQRRLSRFRQLDQRTCIAIRWCHRFG